MRRIRRLRTTVVLLALFVPAPLGGCYRHVVGARGFGAAEPMRMHDPNAPGEKAAKQRRLPSERRDVRGSTP